MHEISGFLENHKVEQHPFDGACAFLTTMYPLGLLLARSPLPGPCGRSSLQPQLQLECPPRGAREARGEVDRTSRTTSARVPFLHHDPVPSLSRKAP